MIIRINLKKLLNIRYVSSEYAESYRVVTSKYYGEEELANYLNGLSVDWKNNITQKITFLGQKGSHMIKQLLKQEDVVKDVDINWNVESDTFYIYRLEFSDV
jgi:hypothetical protein